MEGTMGFKKILGSVLAASFLFSAPAMAGELAGVKLPDTLSVGGRI
jgi:hypothetical protein